ncbi:MAG: hypothetical protein ABIT37_23330 [Luteolibacter sp.]
MKPIPTPASARVFADLIHLPVMEQNWVILQYWHSLDNAQVVRLQDFLKDACDSHSDPGSGLYENAKERLLEDTDLSAREKVLLAALMLSELHEIQEFHGRQVTETLRDASNPVNNITAALSGLISRGEAEIGDQGPTARNAHKRYRLTREGLLAAGDIARRNKQGRARS